MRPAVVLTRFSRLSFGLKAARLLCAAGLPPAGSQLISGSEVGAFRAAHSARHRPLKGAILGVVYTGNPTLAAARAAEAQALLAEHGGEPIDDPDQDAIFWRQLQGAAVARGAEGLGELGPTAAKGDIGTLAVGASWQTLELLHSGVTTMTGGSTRAKGWFEDLGPSGGLARFVFQSRTTSVPGHLFIHGLRRTIDVNGGRVAAHGFSAVAQPTGPARPGRGAPATDPVGIDLLAAVKASLDPQHLLNPGAFPPSPPLG